MTDRKKALLWGLEITGIETEDNLSNVHLRQKLADYLNLLIQQDFNALIALLYRIDVSEEKAKKALESKKETETEGEILADQIGRAHV